MILKTWSKPLEPMNWLCYSGDAIERWVFMEALWTDEPAILLLTGPGFVKLETAVICTELNLNEAIASFEDWARSSGRDEEIEPPEYDCYAFEIPNTKPDNLLTLQMDKHGCLHLFKGLVVDIRTWGQNVLYNKLTGLTADYFIQDNVLEILDLLPISQIRCINKGWSTYTDMIPQDHPHLVPTPADRVTTIYHYTHRHTSIPTINPDESPADYAKRLQFIFGGSDAPF